MSTVTLPKAQIAIATVTIAGKRYECTTSAEFVRFFESLFERTGGTTGAGTGDLERAQFDDAGIEEIRSDTFRLRDEVGQLPIPQPPTEANNESPADLMAEIQALRARVEALEQGYSL